MMGLHHRARKCLAAFIRQMKHVSGEVIGIYYPTEIECGGVWPLFWWHEKSIVVGVKCYWFLTYRNLWNISYFQGPAAPT